ncbi:liver-expressed antimicrobial peptide 2 [Denticeps clupeoides]|uniref:Liver-expressed antimicrobial peptide 2 n=1 Tax=Denticeps clupeoides TaxID=299321 RepID=A0AAY4BZX9_9TELE|nr:liver-expressed antimicrobial peptide 2-like [Denticeps clupeoides]
MQDHSLVCRRTLSVWCLILLVILQQVAANPVRLPGGPVARSVPREQSALRRIARMTPLWRIMGTKPFGAYCQNNHECSTGNCRKGHCSFIQHIKS